VSLGRWQLQNGAGRCPRGAASVPGALVEAYQLQNGAANVPGALVEVLGTCNAVIVVLQIAEASTQP